MTTDQLIRKLAPVYLEAVQGAHYDVRGGNPYAEGVLAAAAAALGLEPGDAEDALEVAAYDVTGADDDDE